MEDLMNEMETTMDEIQYIVVKLGNEKYGIDISCVDNICLLYTSPSPRD